MLLTILGGEERVAHLLENGANKQLSEQLLKEEEKQGAPHQISFRDFFCHPSLLGKDLYTIVKFGIVQYVSARFIQFTFIQFGFLVIKYLQMILKTLCAFLALLLELFGVYGDGEFKLYYGCVSFF